MKPSLTVIVLITAMLTSCNLEPGPMSYTNVAIPFEEYQVPETGIIDQPVNIYVSARADNGCWSNIRFLLKQNDDREFDAWAIADFSSDGECPAVEVSADLTLTFTPTRTGDHVISFWMTHNISIRDTVVVVAAPDRK